MYGAFGWVDPWYYTGYIHDYGGLLERFGRTHLSTRVAALWPQSVLFDVLGKPAYALGRWLALMACGAGVTLFLRRRGGLSIAFAGGAAVMVSAPLLLQIQDDYTQWPAVAYAALALPTLTATSWRWVLLGGALASLALNAHEGAILLVLPIVTMAVTQAALTGRWRGVGSWIAATAVGFLLAQVALSLIMAMSYGWTRANWLFQEASLDFAGQLNAGLARNWYLPWNSALQPMGWTVIVAAAWLLVAGAVVAARRMPRASAFVPLAAGSLAAAGLILYAQFVVGGGYAGTTFYIIFPIIFVFVAAWAALATATRGAACRWVAAGAGGTALAATLVFPIVPWQSSVWRIAWWAGVTLSAAAVAVAFMMRSRRTAQATLILGSLALTVGVIAIAPLATKSRAYDGATRAAKGVGVAYLPYGAMRAEDLYATAQRFLDFVQAAVPRDAGEPRTFYPVRQEFQSLGSTLLWGYSCVGCWERDSGFPRFSSGAVTLLANTSHLVTIASTRTGVVRAQTNAARLEPPFRPAGRPTSIGQGAVKAWVGLSVR